MTAARLHLARMERRGREKKKRVTANVAPGFSCMHGLVLIDPPCEKRSSTSSRSANGSVAELGVSVYRLGRQPGRSPALASAETGGIAHTYIQ